MDEAKQRSTPLNASVRLSKDEEHPLDTSKYSYSELERHGYIERRERTGKREREAHTRTPTRVKRPGQPH
jgi:hypothetical protein